MKINIDFCFDNSFKLNSKITIIIIKIIEFDIYHLLCKSAYDNLTSIEVNFNVEFNYGLWLNMIPLKFNIFVWRLMLNRIPTKDI